MTKPLDTWQPGSLPPERVEPAEEDMLAAVRACLELELGLSASVRDLALWLMAFAYGMAWERHKEGMQWDTAGSTSE